MALRLGDILVEKRIITPKELETAVKEQHKTKEVLGKVLIKMGFITERKLLQILAEQQGIPFVDLKNIKIDEKVIKNVSAKFAWHYKIMPISIESNVLTIAISNPFDMWSIDDLEANLSYRVETVLATSTDIMEAIKKYYGVGADTIERILAEESHESRGREIASKDKVEDLEKMVDDASVVKLVNQILQQGIDERATDIHIEHFRDELVLRYRIDGILYDTQVSADIRYLYAAIVARIKVMANLDIVERRLPQDGRVKAKIGNKEYDLRISVIPTLYAENIVIRILPTTMLFDISALGLSKADLGIVEELLKRPHGIIFVTGPTGSGKSTTLYACLSKLNTIERKIITIEDPIEYELRGVSQIQINPKINLTFSQALRSILRHDPDVMMVGEIRDFETAEIAIHSALTGHLVFSTLHTNDAASAAIRLIDIGVEPYLVASSVQAFIAQRLVRVICKNCKEAYQMSDIDWRHFQDLVVGAKESIPTIYKGRGCKACNSTGYMGRTGIYEILLVGNEMRALIMQKAPSEMIKKKALALGMSTLRTDGWQKILAGITTTDEVLRVTQVGE